LKLEQMPLEGSAKELEALMKQKEAEMRTAAKNLEFELAAILRDEILLLEKELKKKEKKVLPEKTKKKSD
jgi:excinuclease UvrABC helicase subunit UvrB